MVTENIQDVLNKLLPAINATAKGVEICDLEYCREKDEVMIVEMWGEHHEIKITGMNPIEVAMAVLKNVNEGR